MEEWEITEFNRRGFVGRPWDTFGPANRWPGADLFQVAQTLLESWGQGGEGCKRQRRSSFSPDPKDRADAGWAWAQRLRPGLWSCVCSWIAPLWEKQGPADVWLKFFTVVSIDNGGFFGFFMCNLYLKVCLGEVRCGTQGVCGAAVVSQDVLWEGAQFLTQMMLQHPFETASCFPRDGIAALIGKAAEASLGRGKKMALLLSLKVGCEIPGKAARSFCWVWDFSLSSWVKPNKSCISLENQSFTCNLGVCWRDSAPCQLLLALLCSCIFNDNLVSPGCPALIFLFVWCKWKSNCHRSRFI